MATGDFLLIIFRGFGFRMNLAESRPGATGFFPNLLQVNFDASPGADFYEENIQHSTSNTQHSMNARMPRTGCSRLNVECFGCGLAALRHCVKSLFRLPENWDEPGTG